MPFHPHPLPLGVSGGRADESMVAMRDGIRLATDVYLPDGAPRGPAVLIRTMYDKNAALTFLPLVAEYFTARGYPVVTQDVRGKGRSEGEFRPFLDEIDDGYDTIDWVAAQRWSGGAVVMFGESYYAWTQWAAITSGHPALRAVVPRCMSTNLEQMVYTGGAFNLATVAVWSPYSVDHRLYDYGPPLDWSVRPLADIVPAWLQGRRSSAFDAFRAAPPGDRFWRSGALWAIRADRIRIPALHIGAWWDEWRAPQLGDWRIATHATSAPQYLRMEVSDHQGGRLMADDDAGVNFLGSEEGVRGYLGRYLDPAIAFYDREVRGIDTGPASQVVVEVAEGGIWEGTTWPPPSARPLRRHLADAGRALEGPDGGALAAEPDTVQSTVSWTHDPCALVPLHMSDPVRVLSEVLPDERAVEVRPDVLTFTGAAVRTPVDLMGPVRATLEATAAAPVVQLVAKLVDVFPDGRARRITEGVRQLERPDPTIPVEIDLKDVAYRLRPGHRLRLEVAASCFPRYLPVLDPEGDSWAALTGRPVEYRLRVGGGARSWLDLTVAEEERCS